MGKSHRTNYINRTILELPFAQPEVIELNYKDKRGRFSSERTQSILNFFHFLSYQLYKSCKQHQSVDGAFSISKKLLISMFSLAGYRRISNQKDHFFNRYFTKSFNGSKVSGMSNAYTMTPDFKDQYINIYLENVFNSFKNLQCIFGEHFSEHQEKEFIFENPEPENADLVLPCRINMEKATVDSFSNVTELFDIYSVQLYAGLNETVNIYYNAENKDSRLFNDYSYINIQGLRKKVRTFLLKGQYDYDIVNAIPTVMLQDYNLRYKKETLSHLEEYVEHSQEIRERISKETGLTIKTVKKTIIAVVNGSKPYIKSGSHYQGILDSGEDMRLFEAALEGHKQFRDIFKDMRSLSSAVKSSLGVDSHRRYWELERMLLDFTRSYLIYKRNPAQLLIHDGFTTLDQIDLDEMTGHIKKYSKLDIKYSEEYLGDLPLSFVAESVKKYPPSCLKLEPVRKYPLTERVL